MQWGQEGLDKLGTGCKCEFSKAAMQEWCLRGLALGSVPISLGQGLKHMGSITLSLMYSNSTSLYETPRVTRSAI